MKYDVTAAIGLLILCIGVGLIHIPAALIVAGAGVIIYAMFGGYAANSKGGPQ